MTRTDVTNKKKKNPQDATLRNTRAAAKQLNTLARQTSDLAALVNRAVRNLEQQAQYIRNLDEAINAMGAANGSRDDVLTQHADRIAAAHNRLDAIAPKVALMPDNYAVRLDAVEKRLLTLEQKP